LSAFHLTLHHPYHQGTNVVIKATMLFCDGCWCIRKCEMTQTHKVKSSLYRYDNKVEMRGLR